MTIDPNVNYMCFTHDTSEEYARKAFVKIWGVEPQLIHKEFRMLWVGPVPLQDGDSKAPARLTGCHQDQVST